MKLTFEGFISSWTGVTLAWVLDKLGTFIVLDSLWFCFPSFISFNSSSRA